MSQANNEDHDDSEPTSVEVPANLTPYNSVTIKLPFVTNIQNLIIAIVAQFEDQEKTSKVKDKRPKCALLDLNECLMLTGTIDEIRLLKEKIRLPQIIFGAKATDPEHQYYLNTVAAKLVTELIRIGEDPRLVDDINDPVEVEKVLKSRTVELGRGMREF